MKVKNYNKFINEDLEQSIDSMDKTVQTYNKYKGRVTSLVNKDDVAKSEDNFAKFIESLPDDEKSSVDMLRTLFSSEMMALKIKSLEEQKKKIEEQIQQRLKELNEIKSKLR